MAKYDRGSLAGVNVLDSLACRERTVALPCFLFELSPSYNMYLSKLSNLSTPFFKVA